jgi:pimeloyl-ACP methyl ester carboxylesterase
MPVAKVNGLSIAYDVVGEGRPWVITPGGRFSRHTPGVEELARSLAEEGNRVLTWDRPNTGESDVCFEGTSESAMQADALAGLLVELDMSPAVIIGGSGGARVSLLTASRHRQVAAGLATWWVSGGAYGLVILATHYCGGSIAAAWRGGMQAVADLPEWSEVLAQNPSNRQRILDNDPKQFVSTMERWMLTYCPSGDELVPGLPDVDARNLDLPALVLRSGSTDLNHRRETTEELARLLPDARICDPPWGDDEWNERSAALTDGSAGGLFVRWPLLAPMLLQWADEVLPQFGGAP